MADISEVSTITQEQIDALFERANALISALPSYGDPDSFYDLADTRTARARSAWQSAAEGLLKIADAAPEGKKFYFQYWAGDAYIGMGDLERALQTKPQPALGGRNSMQTDSILSLKLATGQLITGADIATLFGPKLTKFGKENIIQVAEFLHAKVTKLQEHDGRNLLNEWQADAYLYPHGMPIFSGHASYYLVKQPPQYSFSLSLTAERMCTDLMREAENTFREERDIPRVGEGWVAETALFYAIKDAFPGEAVMQHGRPQWLGRQHLDVYLPDRGIALEYQGEQHDRPIAFFGGEEAYAKNVGRDRIKLAKCAKNGVRIIHVREGYILTDIILEIALGAIDTR